MEDNFEHDMDMLDAECYGCEHEHGCMGNIDASLKEAVIRASKKTGIDVTILPNGVPCRGQLKGYIGIVTHQHGTDHSEFWEIVNKVEYKMEIN